MQRKNIFAELSEDLHNSLVDSEITEVGEAMEVTVGIIEAAHLEGSVEVEVVAEDSNGLWAQPSL